MDEIHIYLSFPLRRRTSTPALVINFGRFVTKYT